MSPCLLVIGWGLLRGGCDLGLGVFLAQGSFPRGRVPREPQRSVPPIPGPRELLQGHMPGALG